MKSIKLLFTAMVIFSIFTSCSISETEKLNNTPPSVSVFNHSISSLIQTSGLVALKRENASWKEFHENYMHTVENNKENEYLHSYKSNLINHQIQNTSILKDLKDENFHVLETYLMDLQQFGRAYPKNNFLILSALKPYLENEKLAQFARTIYKKGLDQKESKKEELDVMLSGLDDEIDLFIKEGLVKDYDENYKIYLPKLKEFFTSE